MLVSNWNLAMALLREYLEATTVHGLRYLLVSRSLVSKFAWFVCITASFATAALICQSNILQWESNPKVLASVQVRFRGFCQQ